MSGLSHTHANLVSFPENVGPEATRMGGNVHRQEYTGQARQVQTLSHCDQGPGFN